MDFNGRRFFRRWILTEVVLRKWTLTELNLAGSVILMMIDCAGS